MRRRKIIPMGYTKPLYVLPFDHRASYISSLFGWKEPLNVEQMHKVAESKQIIYGGFTYAVHHGAPKDAVGVLVDEEFGVGILRDAHQHGYITASSVEKSGQEDFDFTYGENFAQHIEAIDPTFAKVLVRYNPDGDKQMNQLQAQRLKRLSDYLQQKQRLFMFELLVPAQTAQLAQVHKDKRAYEEQLRPSLMRRAIQELQDVGIEPDVWKIEGINQREDCEKMVATVRRNGRDTVSLIVLGSGAEEDRVIHWLKTAASVPGYIGFAVGRTSFMDAVVAYEMKQATAEEAAERIGKRFEEWINLFESGRKGQ